MSCCHHARGTYCDAGEELRDTVRAAFDAKMANARRFPGGNTELHTAWQDATNRFHAHLEGETQTEGTEDMSIIVKGGGTVYPPHPQGPFAMRCIDVVEHKDVETKHGVKNRIQIRMWAGEAADVVVDGVTELVPLFLDSWFNATLGEGSSLRAHVEQWRGQPFTDDELHGFDLERLLDAPAFGQVSHNIVGNKTYANIDSIMRLPQGKDAPDAPSGYVRVCDREEQSNEPAGTLPF